MCISTESTFSVSGVPNFGDRDSRVLFGCYNPQSTATPRKCMGWTPKTTSNFLTCRTYTVRCSTLKLKWKLSLIAPSYLPFNR